MSATTAGEPRRTFGPIVPPGRLLCGLQLPIQATSDAFAETWEHEARPRQLEAVVRKADESGFFYLAVCDHVAVPAAAAARLGSTWYDPTTTLAWVAAMTQRVRVLARSFVLPYRHPLIAAKALMTLDALSDGRLIVGVGAGRLEAEFEALGLDYSVREALLDDGLDVLDAALASEFPDVTNDTWSVRGHAMAPRPVQSPVPVWICGSTERDMERAATRGDGWLPNTTARDDFGAQVARLRRLRAEAVGDVALDIGAVAEPFYVGEPRWDVGNAVTGAPEVLAGRLLELAALGANHVLVRLRSRSVDELLDQLDAFGTSVIPLLDPEGQRSERYDEPSFRDIAVISRQHVQAMETSDAEEVWGAIGNELLLLRTIGRRTGREHKVTLAFWRDRGGAPILVGSYAGAPMHPDWALNLADRAANPDVVVRVRDRTFVADAEFLDGPEYDEIWQQLSLDRPSYRNYSARTSRRFALIRLREHASTKEGT
jgi:deazaflavin-dependent oxidoreductase (nitroreductase family)